jgi:ribosomal protein L7/L12
MTYEQLNWIRSVREDDLAQVALKLASEDWSLFQIYARQLGILPQNMNVEKITKYSVIPTYAEGVHPEVMDECIRLYGKNEDKVAVVRYLREVYGFGLKEGVELMRDLVSYWNYHKMLNLSEG